ncbi:MAG: phosphoglucosamine mutase [Actinomycetota bacterium]
MPRLFGTDGVRGVANTELSAELALGLGRAAAKALGAGGSAERPRVLTVRDPRVSGDLLEAALCAGLLSGGADVIRCGILPTPAAAFLVTNLGTQGAAVISGSHNPAADNGIKFFGHDGFKLSDAEEDRIESLLWDPGPGLTGDGVGRVRVLEDAEERYLAHVARALDGGTLEGLKVVLDCAHGAAFRTSPMALRRAGAEVIAINVVPDGMNINVGCGSTVPELLAQATIEHRADVGLAHDGDADRLIAVDETGKVADGDAILGALALDLKEQGRLAGDLVVTTVMANLGFKRAMATSGIGVIETPVGDRYVIEAMRAHRAVIGGEQSGHVIFSEYSTTGDGLLTGLRLLGRMVSSGKALSELTAVIERFPQVLINIATPDREHVPEAASVRHAVEEARRLLGDRGRVLVRPSGTEPLVRVMVEASKEATARLIAEEIAAVVRDALGGGESP